MKLVLIDNYTIEDYYSTSSTHPAIYSSVEDLKADIQKVYDKYLIDHATYRLAWNNFHDTVKKIHNENNYQSHVGVLDIARKHYNMHMNNIAKASRDQEWEDSLISIKQELAYAEKVVDDIDALIPDLKLPELVEIFVINNNYCINFNYSNFSMDKIEIYTLEEWFEKNVAK